MKYIPTLPIVLLATLFLIGCIKDDDKDCPIVNQTNLKLNFSYTDSLGKDIFKEHINCVHVFIYDEGYNLFQKELVSKDELRKDASMEVYLPSGKYYIVCWGNALYRTEFMNVAASSNLKEAYTSNNSVDIDGFAPNGDPLYFAPTSNSEPIEVIIPEGKQITKEVPFKSAHAEVKIYIKGFEDYSSTKEQLEPILKLSNIPDKYNFQLEASDSFIGYQHAAQYGLLNDEHIAFVQFNTPLFEEDTLSELTLIKPSTGEILTTIRLSEFISNNQIDLFGVDQVVIPIMIEFKGADVTVHLPSWENIPVDPEL